MGSEVLPCWPRVERLRRYPNRQLYLEQIIHKYRRLFRIRDPPLTTKLRKKTAQ